MSDNATEASQHQTTVGSYRPWLWGGVGFLILFSIALTLIFYITYLHLHLTQVQFAKVVMNLDNMVAQNQNDLSTLQKSLQQMQDTLNSQQQIIDELHHAQNGTREAWIIAESQHLVIVASDNLLINSDTALVIKLLQLADKKIAQLKNPKLALISKALATDIAALQNVPTVDPSALYLKLSALNQQLDQLPLIIKKPIDEKNQLQVAEHSHQTWWQRGLAQTWQILRQIIIVRYHQPGERPFVLPDQQDFLYQNIHALFEQAMSAIAHKQPAIYQASLAQASLWIKQYFRAEALATVTILANLSQLQAVNISPELPNLSASLAAFHDYMNSVELSTQ